MGASPGQLAFRVALGRHHHGGLAVPFADFAPDELLDFLKADGAACALSRMRGGTDFLNHAGKKHGFNIRGDATAQIFAIPREHEPAKKPLVLAPSVTGFSQGLSGENDDFESAADSHGILSVNRSRCRRIFFRQLRQHILERHGRDAGAQGRIGLGHFRQAVREGFQVEAGSSG